MIERTIEVSIRCLEKSRTLPQSDVWLCGKEEASSAVGGLLTEASRTRPTQNLNTSPAEGSAVWVT